METEKIANLLGNVDDESLKFATRKCYVINAIEIIQTTVMEMKMVEPLNLKLESLNQIFVTIQTHIFLKSIYSTNGDVNTKVTFKSCAPFTKFVTAINDEHVDNAYNLDIVMPMYNFIEYSDNYSDTSGSLWHFKRGGQNMNNGSPVDVTTANS